MFVQFVVQLQMLFLLLLNVFLLLLVSMSLILNRYIFFLLLKITKLQGYLLESINLHKQKHRDYGCVALGRREYTKCNDVSCLLFSRIKHYLSNHTCIFVEIQVFFMVPTDKEDI